MFRKLSKRAQTTAEYAILIAIVVGAVVAMQIYIKRGMQGRVKDVVDYTGSDMMNGANSTFTFHAANEGGQYEPYYSSSNASSSQNASESETFTAGGGGGKSSNVTSGANRTGTTGW